MNTKNHNYSATIFECVELDNKIALQMESTPPKAPGESRINAPSI
ncbi:MAG: hypothetical protein WCK78_06945 [Paludibacter sp.]